MSKKWIETEAQRWVEKEIITEHQKTQIVELYPENKYGIGILPILAGLFIGLSILSFIAANWEGISPLLRLLIIIVMLCGLYYSGEKLQQRGQLLMGEGMIATGLLTFGAGIFLIGQTYHIMTYSAIFFLIWGIAGILLTYLYRSRFIFLITFMIFMVAQFYSQEEYNSFSYLTLVGLVAGLGWFVYQQKKLWMMLLFLAGVFVQLGIFLDELNISYLWLSLMLPALYTLQSLVSQSSLQRALRRFTLGTAYLYGIWVVLVHGPYFYDFVDHQLNPYVYIPIWLCLFIAHFWLRQKHKQTMMMLEWVLFLPVFLLTNYADYAYLVMLLLFSLYMLFYGYNEQSRSTIRLGTWSFVGMTLLAYTKLTWAFMDKSIFFLTAGILLWGLSVFLHKKNKQMLVWGGDEDDEES